MENAGTVEIQYPIQPYLIFLPQKYHQTYYDPQTTIRKTYTYVYIYTTKYDTT